MDSSQSGTEPMRKRQLEPATSLRRPWLMCVCCKQCEVNGLKSIDAMGKELKKPQAPCAAE